jgi:hypothetical protein
MLVWGGTVGGTESEAMRPTVLFDGGRYDPVIDMWSPISSWTPSAAPLASVDIEAVWAGQEMVIWVTGFTAGPSRRRFGEGARYNPRTDTWTPLIPPEGFALAELNGAALIWTGEEVILWGSDGGTGSTLPASNGMMWNPNSDAWTPIAGDGAPTNRTGFANAWTGDRMLIWGGADGIAATLGGATYDPIANRWEPISDEGAPSPRTSMAHHWTGRELIVWSGLHRPATRIIRLYDGGAYDPDGDRWRPLPQAPITGRYNASMVWTGSEMIVFGGNGRVDGRPGMPVEPSGPSISLNDGARYIPPCN